MGKLKEPKAWMDDFQQFIKAKVIPETEESNFSHISVSNPFDELEALRANPIRDLDHLLKTTFEKSIRIHHPHTIGHQVCPPQMETIVANWFGDYMNYGMAVYEMGFFPSILEEYVIESLGKHFGFKDKVGGVLTSGGSLGNLTSLLAARNTMPDNSIFVLKENCHYSNTRSLKVLGIPESRITKIVGWSELKNLDSAIPYIILTSACSTAFGEFDPIAEICDFAADHGSCFVHVDAAHGGAAIFSEKLKPLLHGIDQADAVVFDFHKMAMCPSLVTAVIYKNPKTSYATFQEDANYLWDDQDQEVVFNRANQTIECTKPPLSLKAYTALEIIGTKKIGEYNEEVVSTTKSFASYLNEHPDFEIAHNPSFNILVFRCLRVKSQFALRKKLLEKGSFYITQTKWKGQEYLRISVMNPATNLAVLQSLSAELLQLAAVPL